MKNIFSSNDNLERVLIGIAKRFYFASLPLGVLAGLALYFFSGPLRYIGWILMTWFLFEAVIKVIYVAKSAER